MAQIYNTVAEFANGLIVAQVKYNDQNLSILSSRIINNSDFAAVIRVELDPPISGWSVVEATGPAHQTVEQNFPNSVVKYTRDPSDGSLSLVGVSIFCRWPA